VSETGRHNPWRVLRSHPVPVAIILLSLFVHGLQASALGLYWDDAPQLIQGLHALEHQALAFILSDTAAALRSERPLAYLAFGITRAAFLHSVAAVHWVLVALLTVDALAIAAVARCLVDEDWFAFAAAAVFLCYPLAPLQPVWAATVHYHVACLLTLTSILCLVRGLTGPVAYRRGWTSVGFGAYLAGIATHEGLALVPPAFFVARWLCTLGPGAQTGGHAEPEERRRIGFRLLGFTGILALFGVWRLAILPNYGHQLYPIPRDRLSARVLLPKFWHGAIDAALPWRNAVAYLLRSRLTGHWLLAAAAAAAVAAGVASLALLRRGQLTDGRWACALASGVAMLGAGVAALSLSPINIEYALGPSYGSRGNFVAMPGIAIGLPALLALFGLPWRRFSVTVAHLVPSTALACVVFVGSLVHFSVKKEFVREWEGQKARLTTLLALAPCIADSTLVVILDDRDRRAPYEDHYEMSIYLLVLYDNWSLFGNTTPHLRFYRDGVESTYPGWWFGPGERGVYATATLRPVGRISYDRVLLFANDHGRLRAVGDTVVTGEDGRELRMRSNVSRICARPPASTHTWRHLTR